MKRATYRYTLERTFTSRPTRSDSVTFIGLNPSTADETHDDPTIRRCISFATAWGYQRLIVVNLFAMRATKPEDLKRAHQPIGVDNDVAIQNAVRRSSMTIVCWGNHGRWQQRDEQVLAMLGKSCHCLQQNLSGTPAHPLYQPASRTPMDFTP